MCTNAVDPDVRSETRETIAMAEYVGHTSLQIKNYEHSSCAKPVQQGESVSTAGSRVVRLLRRYCTALNPSE